MDISEDLFLIAYHRRRKPGDSTEEGPGNRGPAVSTLLNLPNCERKR